MIGRSMRVQIAIIIVSLGLSPAADSAVHARSQSPEATYVVRLQRDPIRPNGPVDSLRSLGATVTGRIPRLDMYEIEVPVAMEGELAEEAGVKWLVPTRTAQISAITPNDPLVSRQWPLTKMRVKQAWDSLRGKGQPVTVAVIDTGVDRSHPDLQKRVEAGSDLINRDLDPSDDHGHGTHVAGVIAANIGNRTGIAGMARTTTILNIKACDSEGRCPEFEVTAAIVRAAALGAKVVNLSLGGAGDSCPLYYQAAAEFAARQGVLLVAASGNAGEQGNPREYPAGCDGYVAVGATDESDQHAAFSGHHRYVDLAAPGVSILSTVPPAVAMEDDPATHGYGIAQGTSMAAPHVSGLAAMLLSLHPDWAVDQVLDRMQDTATDLGRPGRDPLFGFGRIDAARALSR